MAGQGAPTAIDPSVARRCLVRRRQESRRRCAPAASDRRAPLRHATEPAALQHPRPNAEIAYGGEVSWPVPLVQGPTRRMAFLILVAGCSASAVQWNENNG